jgi:hypothetical protein
MTGKNANIYFPEKTYDKLRQVAGPKISRFVSEAVEEKIEREGQRKEEQQKQQLIKDYQAQAKNKKLQKELRTMEETQFEDLNNE